MERTYLLEQHHHRFVLLTESTDLIAWATNKQGFCCYLSPGWFTFTGAPEGHGIGLSWISSIHPDDAARIRRAFFHANDTLTAYSASFRLLRPNERYSEVWAVAYPTFNDGGEFQGFEGTVGTVSALHHDVEIDRDKPPLASNHWRLTNRELEILRLISSGNTSDKVAAILGITSRTVDTHITNAGQKLGAFNRVHAVALALRLQLI